MTDASAVRTELDRVIERFPGEEALARRLFVTHPAFRSACEDYHLARQGLANFEKLAALAPRSELAEYKALVRDLEAELMAMFTAADGVDRPPEIGESEPQLH